MIRASLISLLLLATPAAAKTVVLDDRPGGYVLHHVKQADYWLKHRTRVIIAGHQKSAAAIQVVYFAGRGGRVCAKRNAKLYFHMGRMPDGTPVDANRRILGRSIKEGWYSPAKFGIGACR